MPIFDDSFHFLSHGVPAVDLVHEAIAFAVDNQSAHTPQCFCGKKLGFCVDVRWIDEPCGVNLDLVEVTQGCRA